VQDLDRVRAATAVDISTLAIRLDEAVRLVDELPLLSLPERRSAPRQGARAAASAPAASSPAAEPVLPAEPAASWLSFVRTNSVALSTRVWDEMRGLIRITPIDQPEAMLIAPEQAFFLRENLKLRLLNARLALLSRQFDTAQSDLRDALSALERYFDRSSRRVLNATDLVRQVSVQARQVSVPRPDATLAAMAAVAGGR
jgi:uroporphyrin-3 C-methyltransferase